MQQQSIPVLRRDPGGGDVFFWALPKQRLDPLLRFFGPFVAHIFRQNLENSLNRDFDFGNEYFDNDYGQKLF